MTIKENKKTGTNVVKNNANKIIVKNNQNAKKETKIVKNPTLEQVLKELDKLKKENEELKKTKEKFSNLETAKEVFEIKNNILHKIKIFERKKDQIETMMEEEEKNDNFETTGATITLSHHYNDYTIKNTFIVKRVLRGVLKEIDAKVQELETELTEI